MKDKPIDALTVGDLEEMITKIVRKVVREEVSRDYYVNEEGVKVLYREEDIDPEYLAELDRHVENLDWLSSNMAELRRLHAGQWIAIAHGEVIASAPTLPDLVEAAEATGAASPFVTFISDQEITWDMAYG